MKITRLELENVKRVRAVEITPAVNGLTVIGGRNGQGKTSILDAIAWALGGEKYRPTEAQREGSVTPPRLHVVLDNGIVVDREGKNSTLRVTDPTGKRAGQTLLDEFVEKLALDLPRFMAQTGKEKAMTLLRIIGKEEEVKRLDDQEQQLYNRRHALGQIADQKKKYADEMASFPGVPEAPVSAGELIQRQQEILARNAQRMQWARDYDSIMAEREAVDTQIEAAEARLRELRTRSQELEKKAIAAAKSPREMQMESTAELEQSIAQVDEINRQVRANLDKERASQEAEELREQYNGMTQEIEQIRDQRMRLLQEANLPLPGLTVENGELRYLGRAWDCMSGSEQLRVAVAIVRAINPKCGFVLLDKTEQMDEETLRNFGAWLEAEGLQAIVTRVSTGKECEIIIEDGAVAAPQPLTAWKEGVF